MNPLIEWALVALVVAIIAGLFGFALVAQGATSAGRGLALPGHSDHVFGARLFGCEHPHLNFRDSSVRMEKQLSNKVEASMIPLGVP